MHLLQLGDETDKMYTTPGALCVCELSVWQHTRAEGTGSFLLQVFSLFLIYNGF